MFIKSKETKSAEKIMIDFIEAKITYDDYIKEYVENPHIYKLIYKVYKKKYAFLPFTPEYIKEKKTFSYRVNIAADVDNYLIAKKIPHEIKNSDLVTHRKCYKYVPNWLSFDDYDILKNLIENIVDNPSIKNKKKVIQEKIKSVFVKIFL